MTRHRDITHWHSENAPKNHRHGEYAPLSSVTDPVLSAGYASVPSLLAGASTTVQVTLRLAMADTSYQEIPALTGTAQLLGALSITGSTIVSKTRVDVTVQNTGLLTLAGSTVLVIALKP